MALKDEFSELYRREHALHFTPERTTLEVDTLVAALTLRPHERVLDLGCGWGRHLTELKQRGFTGLVGIDVQGAFLEPVDGVTMLAGDAGALEFENEFDAVYCAFSALFQLRTPPQKFSPRSLARSNPADAFYLTPPTVRGWRSLIRRGRGGVAGICRGCSRKPVSTCSQAHKSYSSGVSLRAVIPKPITPRR